MSVTLQESLLDLGDEAVPGRLRPERVPLSRGAWVDVQRGWLAGSAPLFTRLAQAVPWRAERRRMYDRTVDVPRLLCFYGENAPLPDPALDACRDALNAHYAAELGEPFVTAGLCFYRDGGTASPGTATPSGAARPRTRWSDSLARRGAAAAAAARAAASVRPRGPSAGTLRYNLGHGDLIVMGGSCQRTWEHAVPKSARPAGPRISVQFRPRGVR